MTTTTQPQPLKQYPAGALLRVREICGDRKAGLPGLLPIASRTWLKWVEEGRVPQGMLLGPRTRVWKIEQVLVVRDGAQAEQQLEDQPAAS
jgi:hypothetical protein